MTGLSKAQKQITSFSEGVESRLGSISTDRLTSGLANIDTKAVPAANKLGKSLGRLQRPVKGSTQAVINFNRIIQDAPFGIIGVANNLEPMITEFQKLGTETSTTGDKLQLLLKKSFTGPGALITAVSVASSLLLVFSTRMRGSGKEAGEASEQVKAYVDAAKELNDTLKTDTGFADQIQREIDRNRQAIQLAEERANIEDKILDIKEGAVGQNAVLSDSQREQIQSLRNEVDATNQLINALGHEDTEIEKLQQSLTVLTRKQELYNGVVGTSDTKIAAFVDTVTGQAQKAINNFEAGIESASDQVRNSRQEIINLIGSFRALANNGQTELVPLIQILQKSLKDLNNTTKDTGEEALKAIDPVAMGFTQWESRIKSTDEAVKAISVSLDKMPSVSEKFQEEDFPTGTIGAMEQELQILQAALRRVQPGSESFRVLAERINLTEEQLAQLRGSSAEDFSAMTAFAQNFGNVLSQAVIHGKDLQSVLGNIAKQLASRAIVTGLGALLTGGASLGGAGFFGALFGGVFHDGGVVPGPLGKERLILAQGGETVMTPQQMRSIGGKKTTIQVPVYLDNRKIAQAEATYTDRSSR